MAWDVHIHLCFPCSKNEAVASLAKEHRPSVEDTAAQWFLDDLSERTGINRGPKGGLSMWGMVGNHTHVESFCESLRPFWSDLLGEIEGGPLSFERIVVFEEQEQSERATAYEIGWDDPHSENRELFITKHEDLPFSWRQF